MNERKQRIKYLISDFFSSALAWSLFYAFRKIYIERPLYGEVPITISATLVLGIVFIPLFWITIHYLAGYYREVYRKSRLKELFETFGITILGVIVLYFFLLIDDTVSGPGDYYKLVIVLFSLQFFISYSFRLGITYSTLKRIRRKKILFNTLVIGDNEKAISIIKEYNSELNTSGNKLVGFLSFKEKKRYNLIDHIDHLGTKKDLRKVIEEHQIKEVFLALEDKDKADIESVLSDLSLFMIGIRAIPTMYDILLGKVKMASILGEPLMQVSHELMSPFEFYFKRLLDVFISVFVMVFLFPGILVIAIVIKLTSPGPIIFAQERIGQYGKPFKIYKFRSMYVDAESGGPQLSSKNDPRITKIGRFMRKTRIDEIPNFWNVLKGDMSMVGPRPERQFYINQIISKAPHYIYLQKVKPGITSWGQVKFGYAESLEEMIERLKYDLIYIENMSVLVDFKILIYTFIIIFKGKGV